MQRSAASHMTRSRRHILLLIFSGWQYDLLNWLYPYITPMLSSLFFFPLFLSLLGEKCHSSSSMLPHLHISFTFTYCNSITKYLSVPDDKEACIFTVAQIRKYTCIIRIKTLFHILTNKLKSNLFPFKHKM